MYPPVQYVYSQQPVYQQQVYQQQGGQVPVQQAYPQQTYVVQQPYGGGYAPPAVATAGPPTGRWRDGICDWGSNMFPSCCCVFCFGGVGPAWIISQISMKTGYINFYNIIRPFAFLYILAWILEIITGNGMKLYIILHNTL